MKKILHVVGGMNIGGTETMLMNIYRNIDRSKVQYDFISYYKKEGYYDREIKRLGGKVISLPPPESVGLLKTVRDLMRAIKENGPYEAIHCHTLFNCGLGVLTGYLSRIKVRIAHAHTTSDRENSIIKKLYIHLMRTLIALFSTDMAACSKKAAFYLFGNRVINNKKYVYLPNYIEYHRFVSIKNNIYVREELNLKGDEKVVGHVGRFIDAKNHQFLVEVMGEMVQRDDKIRGVFVGDGVLRKNIEMQVSAMGLKEKICFLGLRKDIPEILSCMDLFVFPSTYEGLGIVLLEAQAAGLPCLVSEAIQNEADLGIGLVNRLSLSDGAAIWAKTALNMLDKKISDEELIVKSFKRNGYDLENILDKLSEIYEVKEIRNYYEKCIDSVI